MKNILTQVSWLIAAVANIGNQKTDTEKEKLRHGFLVYMGLLMSGGGILWGSICVYFELWLPSVIPFGYTVLTGANFIYFYVSKNFKFVRFIQVLISLLLPFVFQWCLGGFIPSGAVMLWSMLALLGSLTFQDAKLSMRWLITYLLFTISSGFIDRYVKHWPVGPAAETPHGGAYGLFDYATRRTKSGIGRDIAFAERNAKPA